MDACQGGERAALDPYKHTFIFISLCLVRYRRCKWSRQRHPSWSETLSPMTQAAPYAHRHRTIAVVLRGNMDKSDCHAWRRPATTRASSHRRYGACRPCRLRRAVATSMRAQSCRDIPRRARIEHDGEWIEHERQCALLHRNALRDDRVAFVPALCWRSHYTRMLSTVACRSPCSRA